MILATSIKILTAGILLFIAFILVRDRRGDFRAITGSVFLVSVSLYMWCAIVHTSQSHSLIWLPLYAGCFSVPFCFYLFSRSLFEDDFKPGWFHIVLLVVILSLGYVQLLASDVSFVEAGVLNDLAKITLQLGPALISIVLIGQAILRVYTGRSSDLVESRRNFRRIFVLGVGSYAILVIAVEVWLKGSRAAESIDLIHSLVLACLAVYFGQKAVMLRATAFEPARPESTPSDPRDEETTQRLRAMMEREFLYREEGLTIGTLASRLSVQEYKLRRLINGNLGYRNFNDFLNFYRIAEAAKVLIENHELPILRIAMDLGYGSLAPFNRAFKSMHGTTPSEYRKFGGGISSEPKTAGDH
ncbi:MAG: helix-turn-helix transcriptional regulator [Leptospirales bacterium]|nr:helix-turn-helix transcriptional regulator [Leptospirales bacterium]